MQLEKLIIQRLEKTGKAHVSGWGTFYLKSETTRWNYITNTAFPAGDYVYFSASPSSQNDHIVPEVMKTLGTSMEVAQQWIVRKIKGWQDQLDQGNVVMLPGLGSFAAPGKFNAEPGTFDANSFGFVAVMLHPLSEQSALQSKVLSSIKRTTEDAPSALKTWQRAAAAAAVAALFGLGVAQSSVATQVAGWFASVPTIEATTVTAEEDEAEQLEVNAAIEVEAEIESAPEVQAQAVQQGLFKSGYSIVVGSFKEGQNADAYAAELANKGFEVYLIPGSLTKVGIGYYSDRASAAASVSSLKSSINSGAWIYAF